MLYVGKTPKMNSCFTCWNVLKTDSLTLKRSASSDCFELLTQVARQKGRKEIFTRIESAN